MTKSDEFNSFMKDKVVTMTFNLGTIMGMDRPSTLAFLGVHDKTLWPPRPELITLLRQYALDIQEDK